MTVKKGNTYYQNRGKEINGGLLWTLIHLTNK